MRLVWLVRHMRPRESLFRPRHECLQSFYSLSARIAAVSRVTEQYLILELAGKAHSLHAACGFLRVFFVQRKLGEQRVP